MSIGHVIIVNNLYIIYAYTRTFIHTYTYINLSLLLQVYIENLDY